MVPMETPLLKGGHNKEDLASPANYGSTGNKQGVRTAKEPNVSTGNEQSASTGNGQDARAKNTQANNTGSKQDKSMKTGQAASLAGGKDVKIAMNPNVGEAYRAKLLSSRGTQIFQGIMLNFALLMANAAQLMTALDGGYSQFHFFLLVIVISLSIILEIVAGALMFYAATLDMNNDQLHEKYDILDMAVTVLAGPVAAFNVLILALGRKDHTFTWRFSPIGLNISQTVTYEG